MASKFRMRNDRDGLSQNRDGFEAKSTLHFLNVLNSLWRVGTSRDGFFVLYPHMRAIKVIKETVTLLAPTRPLAGQAQ
jgi:hypothetical protein